MDMIQTIRIQKDMNIPNRVPWEELFYVICTQLGKA